MKGLSFWNKFLLMLGYTYLVNKRTGEIHDLKNPQKNCHVESMSEKNKFLAPPKDIDKLLETYDGCRWCMKEKNKH